MVQGWTHDAGQLPDGQPRIQPEQRRELRTPGSDTCTGTESVVPACPARTFTLVCCFGLSGCQSWQGVNCAECGEHFELGGMDADHITPWSQGVRTNDANCQMLCKTHNRRNDAR